MRMLVSVIAIALLLVPDWALAQASIPLITTQPTANGGSDYSLSLQILLLMSLLTLLACRAHHHDIVYPHFNCAGYFATGVGHHHDPQ